MKLLDCDVVFVAPVRKISLEIASHFQVLICSEASGNQLVILCKPFVASPIPVCPNWQGENHMKVLKVCEMSWWVPCAIVSWCLLCTLLLQLPPFMEKGSHVVRTGAGERLIAALIFQRRSFRAQSFFAQLQGRSPWSSPFIKDLWLHPVSLSKVKHILVV